MNGSGTTATFTTIHAGSVVVQFKSDASVSSPPWEAHVAHRTNPFGVGPEITEPNLDPVTDNNFVFSYTPGQAWPDGACNRKPFVGARLRSGSTGPFLTLAVASSLSPLATGPTRIRRSPTVGCPQRTRTLATRSSRSSGNPTIARTRLRFNSSSPRRTTR
jgi:hypothetical protein